MKTHQYNRQDPQSIRQMFKSIAKDYDRGNRLLSMNFHRLWNHALVRDVILPTQPKVLLDLCCGTGDITFTFLKKMQRVNFRHRLVGGELLPPCNIYMIDFCKEMLDYAKEKAENVPFEGCSMQFICGDAQCLPLPSCSVDCVAMAYGIRNVLDRKLAIAEAYRVLKPEGTLGILELTAPENPLLRQMHHIYLKNALPVLGGFVTSDEKAYQYLSQSIQDFIEPMELIKLVQGAGFKRCWKRSLTGGIATIFFGQKL